MTVRKKIFYTLLPLILAVLLIAVCLMIPVGLSDSRLMSAATSLGTGVMTNDVTKQQAMDDERFIPFFGSSELRRFDVAHPSVIAKKYDRSYTPFLLGTKGTQSLTHFLFIHSMETSGLGKRAVFIISPQWFQSYGIIEAGFEQFCSPLASVDYICDKSTDPAERIYFAKRMLGFDFVKSDAFLNSAFEVIANGDEPDDNLLHIAESRQRLLNAEDRFFSNFFIESHDRVIKSRLALLPSTYDVPKIKKAITNIGRKQTSNNPFHISNGFYTWRIKPHLKSWKNKQKNISYDKSPEYGDFELVLSQMASKEMDVLFVIPPLNEEWTAYTGLSQEMFTRFVTKIRTQLESQGFNNIVDLSECGDEPYFMQDTIHIGWLGWLAMDEAVKPFLEAPRQEAPVYNIDSYYYSDEWRSKIMEPADTTAKDAKEAKENAAKETMPEKAA
jgi:D-alanine transfer protein